MLLALTVWNGRISPVCDVARQLLIMEVKDGKVIARREERLNGADPWQQFARLEELKLDTLICGAISEPLARLLTTKDVRIIPFISGTIEAVLAAHLKGTLLKPAFAMPGCCGHGGRFRGSGGGRSRGACFGRTRTSM